MRFFMMFLMTLLLAGSSYSASTLILKDIDFDLIKLEKSKKAQDCDYNVKVFKELEPLVDTVNDDRFWTTQNPKDGVYVKLTKLKDENPILPLGTTNKEALSMSRDLKNTTVFSEGHEQGDLANRWAHSYLARIPGEIIKRNGGSELASSLVGLLFFVPKEFLYDLHPSSGDLVVTYTDKLGTKNSSFQITMFGDAIYKKRPFEDVQPLKESSPFITWKRKF